MIRRATQARVLEGWSKLVVALALLVAMVLAAGPAASQTPEFDDVPIDHLFYTEISWAADLGIAAGYPDGTFGPTRTVTRQAAVAFLHRLWLGLGNTDTAYPDPGFSDVAPGDPFYDDIAWAADLGIAAGYPDGTFGPTRTVTRQAMVAFIHRLAQTLGTWFVVDTPLDAPDTTPGDGTCDIGDGTCSLRAAIQETNALATPDVITIAKDTNPTLTIPGTDEDASATGDLDITDDLAINGNGTTIDAKGIDRVIHQHAAALTIVNATVTGGSAENGGGIYNDGGAVKLATVTVSQNSGGYGLQVGGGGIYNKDGSLAVTNTDIVDNSAERGSGAGVYNKDGTTIIADSNIADGTSDNGGGVFTNGGTTTITNSTISGNAGGGIGNKGSALKITNSSLFENTTESWGGGVETISGTTIIDGSTIRDNVARMGGGISNANLGTSLTVTNTSITNNLATRTGGGVHSKNATTTIAYTTIAENEAADTGGGINRNGGTFVVTSSVLASNSGSNCSRILSSGGYNLDRDGSCSFADSTDLPSANSLLGPLTDNGGPTLSHLPFADSPLVDAIPPGASKCGTTIATDQRGIARPAGAGCDIGAIEGTGPISPTPLDLTVDTGIDAIDTALGDGACDIGDGTCSIRAAIQETNASAADDTITIAGGVLPTLTIVGAGENEAVTGDLDVYGWLTVIGDGATIEANGIDRVIDLRAGALTINSSTIRGGAADSGGGIRSNGGVLALDGMTITNNSALDGGLGEGGGILTAGTLSLTDSAIVSNTSDDSGGGISASGSVTIADTTLADNAAEFRGGGLAADGNTAIDGSTISGNYAKFYGGGVANSSEGTLTVTNTTIVNNRSRDGGGIANLYSTTVVAYTTMDANNALGHTLIEGKGDDIFTFNGTVTVLSSAMASQGTTSACFGGIQSSGFNLDSDGSCGFTSSTDLPEQDPLLGPLADNGGPTLTLLPGISSPLIGAIPPGANGCGSTVITDQRGLPRPIGVGCDVGAVERQDADP